MSKLVSSAAPKCLRHLMLVTQRYISCHHNSKWCKAPLCKGRILPKEVEPCQQKVGSCSARMGACPSRRPPLCPSGQPTADIFCCRDDRLTKHACDKPDVKVQMQEIGKPFVSMWETGGIESQCPDAVERLDEIYYQPTDKNKRTYTLTWKVCGPNTIKRKVCCVNDMCMLPPINKREKTECPQTAKEQDVEQLKVDYNVLKQCLQKQLTINNKRKGKGKCYKITMPCCRAVAKSLKCHKRYKTDCLKQCCPHPSFSECDHPQLKDALPSECRCSHFVTHCDANQFLAYKLRFKTPPALPAWPPKERPK